MNKNAFIVSVVLVVAILFAGCSDSNDNNNPINDETGEFEFTHDTKDVSVTFQLLNENGEETNTFKEGENVVFRLEVKNSGPISVILPENRYIVGHDLFRVFSTDAKDWGTPWDKLVGVFTYMRGHSILGANSSTVYVCPWLNKAESILPKDSYLDFQIDGIKPLPAGDYYSEFDIMLSDSQKITCKREFKITP